MRKIFCFIFLVVLFSCSIIPVFSLGQTKSSSDEKPEQSFQEKPTGFYNVTSFTPVTFNGDLFNGVQTVCGYKVLPYLAFGGGLGYERFKSIPTYDNFKTDLSLLPVFVDIRYTILNGKVSPVIALDAGYRILLNRPTTQTVYDTSYYSVITVSGRSVYADKDLYWQGGPFITTALGLKVRLYGRWSAYLAGEYSLWSISGDRYTTETKFLLGSNDIWSKVGYSESTVRTTAYLHLFQVRLGIVF